MESQLVPEHCPKPVFVNDPFCSLPCAFPLCPINLPATSRNVCHHQACLPMTPPPSRCPTWDLDSNRWLLPKPLPSHRMPENTSETWQILLLSRTFYTSSHHWGFRILIHDIHVKTPDHINCIYVYVSIYCIYRWYAQCTSIPSTNNINTFFHLWSPALCCC